MKPITRSCAPVFSAAAARRSQDTAPRGLGRVKQVRALGPPEAVCFCGVGGLGLHPCLGPSCTAGTALVWRLLLAAPPSGHRFAVSQTPSPLSPQAGRPVPFTSEAETRLCAVVLMPRHAGAQQVSF